MSDLGITKRIEYVPIGTSALLIPKAGLIHDDWDGTGRRPSIGFGAFLEGGTFHTIPAICCRTFQDPWHDFSHTAQVEAYQIRYEHSRYGFDIYQPIHSSMTRADIEGAVYAFDDGTHWHFYHNTPADHHEMECFYRSYVDAVFNTVIGQNVWAAGWEDLSWTQKLALHVERDIDVQLYRFKNDMLTAGLTAMRKLPLGYYGKNAHKAHVKDIAAAAFTETAEAWKVDEKRLVKLADYSTTFILINNIIKERPIVKTQAQLKAEAAAIAAAKKAADAATAEGE